MGQRPPLWALPDLARRLDATHGVPLPNTPVSGVCHRLEWVRHGDLFVALPYEGVDGHDQLGQAASRGAAAALVDRNVVHSPLPTLRVGDVRKAVNRLAVDARQNSTAKRIAVTGKVGKTFTKDALWKTLSRFGDCHRTLGNNNDRIGTAISLADLHPNHQFGVFEVSRATGGDIASSVADKTRLLRPEVAVFTRIGDGHPSHAAYLSPIVECKSKLMLTAHTVVLNRDDESFGLLMNEAERHGVGSVITYGTHADANVRLDEAIPTDDGFNIQVKTGQGATLYHTHLRGRHNIENVLAVIAASYGCGLPIDRLTEPIESLTVARGRGFCYRVGGRNAFQVIDATRSAEFASVQAMLRQLGETRSNRRIVVLGDIPDLSQQESRQLHRDLADEIVANRVEHAFLVGKQIHATSDPLRHRIPVESFSTWSEALPRVRECLSRDDCLLVQGWRKIGLHRLVKSLVGNSYRGWWEDDFDHDSHRSAKPDPDLGKPIPIGELRVDIVDRFETFESFIVSCLDPDSELDAGAWEHEGWTAQDVVSAIFRSNGKRIRSITASAPNASSAVRNAVQSALQGESLNESDTLEITFAVGGRDVELQHQRNWNQLTASIRRGLAGYRLSHPTSSEHSTWINPTEFVATNRAFETILNRFVNEHCPERTDVRSPGIRCEEFACQSFLLARKNQSLSLTPLYRSARLKGREEITADCLRNLERLQSNYLWESIQPDGRMRYLYYPSRATEDESKNNAIRQWMATLALVRSFHRNQTEERAEKLTRNIRYNLLTMLSIENGNAVIVEPGAVKLGAIALAGLALNESNFPELRTDVESLLATTRALWTESGRFNTFFRPSLRRDFQNFYSGEALLFWASSLERQWDEGLYQQFTTSFEHYCDWHRNNRNPAFVPWHTQAYFRAWKLTGDERYLDFIFEMNDWLLDHQQTKHVIADAVGRFFTPSKKYGPPHASSTGVYLEGLADAYQAARLSDDEEQARKYASAILLGLRSIHQLTFTEAYELFFVRNGERLLGGVRTTAYDNRIRVDNVQHCLLAINKLLTEGSHRTNFVSAM